MPDNKTGIARVIPWLPVLVVGAGVVASGAVDSFRLNAYADDLQKVENSVEDNEDAIEEIQRILIRRQGEVKLQVQRIETEQKAQGDDIGQILDILKGLDNGD